LSVCLGGGDGVVAARGATAFGGFRFPGRLVRSNFKSNQSANFSPASRIEHFSIFMTRSRTFPPPHSLKQWKTFFSVWTLKLVPFLPPWMGHGPTSRPGFFS
jgi:hypothetical protein